MQSAHEAMQWERYLLSIDPYQADMARIMEKIWINCDQAWKIVEFREGMLLSKNGNVDLVCSQMIAAETPDFDG